MHSQSDDEDDEYPEAKQFGKDGMIFMVDATTLMFVKDETGECPFRMCLKACVSAMQHKIIYSNSDIISVVFFGTEKSSNDSNLSHIYVFQELKRPSAPIVKQLRTMHESEGFDGFKVKYGHDEDYLLADVLWLAHSMYGKNTTKLASSRILFLTCSEHLGKHDSHSKRQAIARAEDLRGNSITLDIIPCSTDYQPSDFIKTLMSIVEDQSGSWSLPRSHCITSIEDIPKLVEKIAASKDHRSSCLGHIPFKIGKEVTINVELYNLVRQSSRPTKTLLDRVTNDVVKPTVNHFKCTGKELTMDSDVAGSCEFAGEKRTLTQDSKEMLMNFDIAMCQELGGEKIKFTQEEVKAMKRILEPGLLLLGFIPESILRKTHHCRPASFVYPDKSCTSGAKDLFAALWLRMGAKKVAAICSYKLRDGILPHFVALVPAGMDEKQIMKVYKKYGIHTIPEPQGFHLFLLPFSDNVNSLELPERPSAYPHQVGSAIKVLKKLRVAFHPSLFPNPDLDTHWAAVEAIALECPAIRDVTDKIKPNCDEMDKRLGVLANEFLGSVYPCDYDPTKKPSKSAGKTSGISAFNKLDIDFVETAKKYKKVATLTVDILKGYLKAKGKPVSGKRKVELIEDVYSLDG